MTDHDPELKQGVAEIVIKFIVSCSERGTCDDLSDASALAVELSHFLEVPITTTRAWVGDRVQPARNKNEDHA